MIPFSAGSSPRGKTIEVSVTRLTQSIWTASSGKVARTLLYMASRFGSVFGAQSTSSHLKITQQEIANLLGLSRETASAELRNLELKKLISHTRKNYTIYTQKIEEYVENQE